VHPGQRSVATLSSVMTTNIPSPPPSLVRRPQGLPYPVNPVVGLLTDHMIDHRYRRF
jgi:hypothetical protein